MESSMARSVIKGGTVIDATGARGADVAVEGGVITEVSPNIDTTTAQVIDATGCVVGPGLVDLHTHLREPGREEAETFESGARAAALGGFTCVMAMPNTRPDIDNESVVRHIQSISKGVMCDVSIAAAISIGREGRQLVNMSELAKLGVRMFTDDGSCVQSNRLMRRALEYSLPLDVTIGSHCEDYSLSAGGHMHEGAVSSRLGIDGIPLEAEELMVMREIALTKRTGARMHLMHLSTAGSVAMVRAAKEQGLAITAEAAPHHFTLTDDEIASFDPVFKVYPPLRPAVHRDAVREGLSDGTIDAIATDHAPHAPNLKERPFDEAPCGMLGLETALSLALTELGLPIDRVLALMSWQPARIARVEASHGGPVAAGRDANLVVIDPEATWVVDRLALASKAHNTPYQGRQLKGKVRHTFLHGEPVVQDGIAQR
ncbi:MAG: dihydroorotase [Candidatus Dormibacteraceae bacterium]